MKKFKILFAIVCLLSFYVKAADNKYQGIMLSTLELLNHASGNDDYMLCANKFERIAYAEKNLWLPYYYASYACVMMSFNETENTRRDLILDRAQQLLDSAFAIDENESELYVLQAFLYPSRIIVDPMARGMIYIEKCFLSLEKAKTINPENPRTYYLLAVTKLNLPPSMGGGPEVAKSLFLEAQDKFKTFRPENSLMPAWGQEANLMEIEKLATEK